MLGLFLVLLVPTFSVLPSFFLIQISVLAISTDVSAIVAMAAVGTLPIQAGGLDLSVAGVAGLSVVVSLLHATGVDTLVVCILAVAFALLLGLANDALVRRLEAYSLWSSVSRQ